jgi:ethanolamine utilization protein EutM
MRKSSSPGTPGKNFMPNSKFRISTKQTNQQKPMSQQALGMIETRGLIALVEATDTMLKSANVELVGPMTQVGNAMVTAVVAGDVAAVKAATEAGKNAAQSLGEIVSVSVIARPHNDLGAVLPKAK